MKKIQKTKHRIRQEKQDVIDGKIRPQISFSHSKVEEVKSRLKKELKEEEKMNNLTYIDFLKKTRGKGNFALIEDFPNAVEQTHGSKHVSFKKAYQEAYGKIGVKITPVHAPLRLRIGFIEDDGSSQIWHTVRLEAWHTSANKGCELEEYILALETIKMNKAFDMYSPLFVCGIVEGEGYYSISKDIKMTPDELREARKKWEEEDNDCSFCEFLNNGEKMSDIEKKFDEFRKNNKEVISKHILINNNYHQAYYDAEEAGELLRKNLENPIVQRYEELLDIMESEKDE